MFGSLVIVGSPLVAPGARAQESYSSRTPAPLSVTWDGPPECGSAGSLEAAARKLLGKVADSADVEVTARATRLDEARYRVELLLSGAITGTRSLESAECRDAVQAAAVVLALAINPDALNATEEEPTEDVATKPDPPSPPLPHNPEAAPPEGAPSLLFGFVEVAARVSSGLTPFPSWGTEVSGGIDYKSLRARVGAFGIPRQSVSLEPMGEARFIAVGGGVDACYRAFELEPFTLRGCLGMWLTWVRATSVGLEESQSRRALVYSPRALLEFSFSLNSHLSIDLAGGAQMPTTDVRFRVEDNAGPTTVHAISPGGIARAGLEVRF